MAIKSDLYEFTAHFFTTSIEEPAASLTLQDFQGTYEEGLKQIEDLFNAPGNTVIWDEPERTVHRKGVKSRFQGRVVLPKGAVTMITCQYFSPEEAFNEN